jgi:Protein  of unknown function (DUF3018)
MSDTARVRAWRQRLKDSGLVPMTIWVPADTKARYEDLALQSHRRVSELAQHALAAYRLDPSLVSAPITDTEQLQGLIRDEIDQAIAIVTATVTATVTEAVTTALPAMIETALQPYVSDTIAATDTATPQEPSWLTTAEAFVSDMETDTDTDTAAGTPLQGSAAPSVADTVTDTETATQHPPRVAVPGETPVADTATVTAMEAGAGVLTRAREERSVADTETATATATARPRSSKFKITPTQEAELRAKRARGVPVKTLMQEYGLSKATVHRYLAATPGA